MPGERRTVTMLCRFTCWYDVWVGQWDTGRVPTVGLRQLWKWLILIMLEDRLARAVTLTNDISICSPAPSPRGPDNVGVVWLLWLGNILLSDVWRDPQWSAQGHHQHHHQPTLVFTRMSRPLQTSRRNYCVCSTPASGCVTTTNTKKKQRGNVVHWSSRAPPTTCRNFTETLLFSQLGKLLKAGELLKHHKETSDKDRPALHLRRATSGG